MSVKIVPVVTATPTNTPVAPVDKPHRSSSCCPCRRSPQVIKTMSVVTDRLFMEPLPTKRKGPVKDGQ